MSGFPLRYARRNVLIGPGGEAAALYRADTVAYPFLPAAEKWALLHRLERFGHLVGADFSLWRVQRAYPAERYADDLEGSADARHADAEGWRRYLEGHAGAAAPSSTPTCPRSTSRSRCAEPAKGQALRSLGPGPAARRGAGRRRRAAADLRRRAGGAGRRRAAHLRAPGGAIGLRRATTRELQWLLRRGGCRGVAEPVLDGAWEPDALVLGGADGGLGYEPLEHDLWRCANAPMTEDPGEPPSLVVEAEEGRSFQAFLCAGSLAEEAEFPGAAELLFAPLEDAGFPVDAVLHARWIGNREALGQVRKRILDVEHAYREQPEGAHAGPGLAGRGGPRAGPRVRGGPAVLRAPADAAGLPLARGRRRRPRRAGAPGRGAARALRRGPPAPPARPAAPRSSSTTCRAPTAARCATTCSR